MIYLHILGRGNTPAAIANSKGHLFERLTSALFEQLKMSVDHIDKSENGKEIDIDGTTLVGKVKFFAECKAQEDPLNSTDIQKFGYKFLTKQRKDSHIRGYLFTLSPLNQSAQELWDSDLKAEYGDAVECYRHDDIVSLLIQHFGLASPDVVKQQATTKFERAAGDTQLLCVEGTNRSPLLVWAQLLMSSDGTEPNAVVFYSSIGVFITEKDSVESLLAVKPDLATTKLICFNLSTRPATVDDVSPSRTVVRVRMSSDWFDYRFPAAPDFFVGRSSQLSELSNFVRDVRAGRTSTRGFLISGKSGIGKSSLALKSRQFLQKDKVVFLPIDSRLCDDVSFLFDAINELLFEMRQIPELGQGLANVRVRGLDSLITTLLGIHAAMRGNDYLAVLFFDQFEKVFEYPEVTRAIRNLFLRVTEKQLDVLFGFAWKSDLWSLAEGFPHTERDDIVRESCPLKPIVQFGREETLEILKQLEIQWGNRLSTLLSGQLATFSRGLPWLLKKVCAHILEEKSRGITENELIETNLKLQDLFESDLAGLDDEERSLLRALAPLLPTTLRRLSESFEISNIDRSLHRFIDKRILVKITEDVADSLANVKYDAYSDIFREFLITGKVPFEEAYYYYTYPVGAMKFFEKVRERRELSMEDEIHETGKKIASIYNLNRDLRSLGLVDVHNKVFTPTVEVANLEQDEILSFLQSRMKRNRVVSLILSELNENQKVSRANVADLLQDLFPSVQAVDETWEYYSQTTVLWLHYARLAYYNRDDKSLHRVDNEAVFEAVVERGSPLTGLRFPLCFRNSIIELLEAIHASKAGVTIDNLMKSLSLGRYSVEKALSDGLNLHFVNHDAITGLYHLAPIGVDFVQGSPNSRRALFKQQCSDIPVFDQFISYIEAAGRAGMTSRNAAQKLTKDMQLEIAEATMDKLGAMLANWAEYAGILVRFERLCYMKGYLPEQLDMFGQGGR